LRPSADSEQTELPPADAKPSWSRIGATSGTRAGLPPPNSIGHLTGARRIHPHGGGLATIPTKIRRTRRANVWSDDAPATLGPLPRCPHQPGTEEDRPQATQRRCRSLPRRSLGAERSLDAHRVKWDVTGRLKGVKGLLTRNVPQAARILRDQLADLPELTPLEETCEKG
jgi:hypothetical protein